MSRLSKIDFETRLTQIRETIEIGKALDMSPESNPGSLDRLESIVGELEGAFYSQSGSLIRSRLRRENAFFGWRLEDFMDAFIEDPNCMDMDIPISAAAEALYTVRNLEPDEEEFGHQVGQLHASTIAAIDCLCQLATASELLGANFTVVEGEEDEGESVFANGALNGYEHDDEEDEPVHHIPELGAEFDDSEFNELRAIA